MAAAIVLKLVKEIREDLPSAGVPKLHFMLKNKLLAHGIKMGRDALYQLLGELLLDKFCSEIAVSVLLRTIIFQ